MKIDFVHIQNFRKLKSCRIDFSDRETVFVGSNNSGKTSAMNAIILFLKSNNKFTTKDFTLSNWKEINSIGKNWSIEKDINKIDLSITKWEVNLPTLDIWLNIRNEDIHYVHHLIPTLDWDVGLLGIRLRYEPKNLEELYKEFTHKYNNAKTIVNNNNFELWPKDMYDFLENKMESFFTLKSYILNPELKNSPQKLSDSDLPLDGQPLNGLIKIDIINAQHGFSDVNSENLENNNSSKNLSNQLRSYYDKHLNPSINPTENDISALKAIHEAKKIFDSNLKESFKSSLEELEVLNYPGFGNPKINLSSKFNTVESLNHDSSVQYILDDGISDLSLPEKYNGLGYQNLISMIFRLIRFRDEWMKVGKSYNDDNEFEPLHLVLIEEPEVHLHAQVQQVFINQAYNVLRNNSNLKNDKFTTQLVISTHSNHIAHEINFTSLRYFRRIHTKNGNINTSEVVNLSNTFGTNDETTKFSIRYLKTTHCDLFFSDAVILVEGPAEKMLIPYFIKKYSNISNCYISILEIGGSHAHTLKPLIDSLGIICLIITDLDSVNPKDSNKKIQPDMDKGYITDNDTLKNWLPSLKDIDKLLILESFEKQDKKLPIRVSYQIPLKINNGEKDIEIYPYTFEDSLVMENRTIFKELNKGKGLLKKMILASQEIDVKDSAKSMYEAINEKGIKKAEFALELLYFEEPNKIKTPKYIEEGLCWLEDKLKTKKNSLFFETNI